MSNMKSHQPNAPAHTPKVAPTKMPEAGDMEHFHMFAASGALTDMLHKLGGTRKK